MMNWHEIGCHGQFYLCQNKEKYLRHMKHDGYSLRFGGRENTQISFILQFKNRPPLRDESGSFSGI